MIEPPETWETERLLLRRPTRADAPLAFASYTSDTEVPRYTIWRPHQSVVETEQFMRRCEDSWETRTGFPWSLLLKSDGSYAGMLAARINGHAINIGYVLARHLWRRGLMSEAVGALVRWALAQPEIFRVWAVCDVDNVASARLLESVGMQCEGTLRRWILHPNVSDSPRDCLCYAMIRPPQES
jgi:RimJ/RimL family protein N-acetyltransferase